MATSLKLRRGTTTAHGSFTGAEAEVTVDTTKDTVVVHDGSTAGGFPLLREDLSNNTNVTTNSNTQTLSNKTLSAPSVSGNLTFTGTGNRITGDFSNATIANRVAFQTTTANSQTTVNVIPNGTSNAAQIQLLNASDPTNAATAGVQVTSSAALVYTGIQGTGTYLPMTFYTGGSERMRIDTSGNVGIGTAQGSGGAVNAKLDVLSTITSGQTLAIQKWSWNDSTSSANWGLKLDQIHTGSAINYTFRIRNGTTTDIDALYLQSNGNVGIGTTSPVSILEARTTGVTVITAHSNSFSSAGNGTGFGVYRSVTGRSSGYSWNITSSIYDGGSSGTDYQTDSIVFNVRRLTTDASLSEVMRIRPDGNVGIGTSSPLDKLNVSTSSSGGVGGVISVSNAASAAVGNESVIGFRSASQFATNYYSAKIRSIVKNTTPVLSDLAFNVYDSSGPDGKEAMRLHASGGVSIGNTTDSGASSLNVSGSISGGYIAHAAGTTAMAFGSDNVVRVTPNATATYTTTVPAAGAICVLSILTSGTTSYTITFGTGFKSTGTLATGTVSARYFNITFVSDGTNLIEMSRTVAIA